MHEVPERPASLSQGSRFIQRLHMLGLKPFSKALRANLGDLLWHVLLIRAPSPAATFRSRSSVLHFQCLEATLKQKIIKLPMQRIFSSPNPMELSELKQMLEVAGIACFTRNEVSAALLGEIPVTEATPEIWIEDDAKMAEALRVKEEWKTQEKVTGRVWVCPACGEASEAQFTSCWKCGASKSEA
jgi:hypothetical protein